jgi:hypothetical protein
MYGRRRSRCPRRRPNVKADLIETADAHRDGGSEIEQDTKGAIYDA